MTRLRDFLPLTMPGGDPHPPRTRASWVSRHFFTLVFLSTAWIIFLQLVRGDGWINDAVKQHVGFIPSLWLHDPGLALLVAHIGIIVQHSWGQLIYITVLLALVGIPFERRFGPLRTFITFYGSCLAGVALLTGVVLFTAINGPSGWSQQIATTSWSGASVGAFGMLGALIATARTPYPLLGAWATYEAVVEWGLVPGLAIAMHAAGFAFGFIATRIAISPLGAGVSSAGSGSPLPSAVEDGSGP